MTATTEFCQSYAKTREISMVCTSNVSHPTVLSAAARVESINWNTSSRHGTRVTIGVQRYRLDFSTRIRTILINQCAAFRACNKSPLLRVATVDCP